MGMMQSNDKKGGRKISIFGDSVESAIAKEMDEQKDRYVPESLDKLMEETHFSKVDLKYIYQCFKQNCPSGYVSREQFIGIFRQFFVMHKLCVRYNCDVMLNNIVEEFACQLSMFHKGSLEQRLDWLFDLYDSTRRGYIIEDDFVRACVAMYALVGVHFFKDKHIPIKLKRHLRRQFQNIDKNRDGKITREQFVEGCKSDNQMCESMERLRTAW